MKTAEKMFEELGYKFMSRTSTSLRYTNKKGVSIGVNFKYEHWPRNTYYKNSMYEEINITKEEHQAIHQQLKELGWFTTDLDKFVEDNFTAIDESNAHLDNTGFDEPYHLYRKGSIIIRYFNGVTFQLEECNKEIDLEDAKNIIEIWGKM